MITIEADSFRFTVEQNGGVYERRAAEDGCSPYDSPARIRIGDEDGDNCMVTLRWNDTAEQVTATVSREHATGRLPTVTIEPLEADGVAVKVHVRRPTPYRVTRIRRRG